MGVFMPFGGFRSFLRAFGELFLQFQYYLHIFVPQLFKNLKYKEFERNFINRYKTFITSAYKNRVIDLRENRVVLERKVMTKIEPMAFVKQY
jgi:hypothetical protein